MSDDSLSQTEINALIEPLERANFDRRKKQVLKDIDELGIIDFDKHGALVTLDLLEAVVKVFRSNTDILVSLDESIC